MGIYIFSNQTLQALAECLIQFMEIKITMQKGIKAKGITFQKVLLRTKMLSSTEKTLMTN